MSFYPIEIGQDGAKLWHEFSGDWRRTNVIGSYSLYWRDKDGFGQLLPRPSPTEVEAYYDLEAYYTHTSPNTGRDQSGLLRKARSFARKVIEHLAWRVDRGIPANKAYWQDLYADRPRRVLEIGCGHAEKLDWLAETGHEVLGIEPDPKARSIAEKHGVQVLAGTAEELPREATQVGLFDAVLMFHSLEHCIDPKLAVNNAASLLANGGQFVIEVPNNACLGRTFFGPIWYWLDVPRHLNFFTRNSLVNLVESSGLVFDRVEYDGYCRQFAQPWLDAQVHIAKFLDAPPRNSLAALANYLAATAYAGEDKKYDSVRVFFRKP